MNLDIPFYKIIYELCDELEIEIEEYSFGLIRILRKNNKSVSLIRHKFELNSANSVEIANDKYACFEILKSNNIPVINHTMIFNPKTRKDYVSNKDLEICKKLFDKYNKKIVIKANNSYQGIEVFLVEKEEEIEKTILDIFSRNNDSLSICPYENIKNEYRMIVLDNECLFGYKKEKPSIVGDGKKCIGDYILDLNIEKPNKNLDLKYIPKNGEVVNLNWKFNLSGGARALPLNDMELKSKLEMIAVNSSKAVNIRFASVDIVENEDGDLKVMEVNATVCMNKFSKIYDNGYNIAKDIYRKALLRCFD